jgi:hypothetical protein
MPELYRKKTETEKALYAIKLWDMSPVKLQYTFGGDAAEWGRILKGQHQAHGEYLVSVHKVGYFADRPCICSRFVPKRCAKCLF